MKEIDNNKEIFPVRELQERYGIDRSIVHSRLKLLNIKSERCGNKYYITSEQLQLMDDLDAYLKAGGTTAEFVQKCVSCEQIVTCEATLAQDNSEAEETIYAEQSLKEIVEEEIDSVGAEELREVDEEEQGRTRTGKPKASDAAVNEEATTANILNQIEQDIAEIDAQAQYRASSRIIYRNARTVYYELTEDFTIPGLKEQVERSKQYAANFTKKFEELYNPENFLSRSRLAQMLPSGRSGSQSFLNCSKNQSDKLDADESSD